MRLCQVGGGVDCNIALCYGCRLTDYGSHCNIDAAEGRRFPQPNFCRFCSGAYNCVVDPSTAPYTEPFPERVNEAVNMFTNGQKATFWLYIRTLAVNSL